MDQMPDKLPDETHVFFSNRWVVSNTAFGLLVAYACFIIFTREQQSIGYFYAAIIVATLMCIGVGAYLYWTAREKLEYTYWAKNRKSYIRFTRDALYLFGSETRIPWGAISSIRLVRLPGGRGGRSVHLLIGLTREAQVAGTAIANVRQLTSHNVFIASRDRLDENSFLTLPLQQGGEINLTLANDEVLAFSEAYWKAAGGPALVSS